MKSIMETRRPNCFRNIETSRRRIDTQPQHQLTRKPGQEGCGLSPGNLAASLRSSQPTLNGLRVLLAENEPVSALFIAETLRLTGARVACVTDGKQAVKALRDARYDLVIMDIAMPVMDGVEATRRIRNGEAGQGNCGVPILAATAMAMNRDRTRCIEAGMDGYISKPFKMSGLVVAVLDALRP